MDVIIYTMKLKLLLLLAAVSTAHAYHILCVSPIPSHSHNQLGKGIVDALLKNGHEVTWVTAYPDKVGQNPPKSLHIIDVKETQKLTQGVDMSQGRNAERGLAFVKEFSNNITRMTLANVAVRNTIVRTQFDAVVTEAFFSDPMAGIAAIQQAPWILLSSVQMMPNLEEQVDEVRSINTIPLMFNDASTPMSFKERAINLLIYISMSFTSWMERPAVIAMYENIFSPLASARNVPLPPLEDAFKNVSILFVNAHESMSPALSIPPNVINIAGYHIDEVIPPLPSDLQQLLDKSKQGVIYFSMGSVLRSSALKPKTRKALLAKFAKLPHTVLWKFEEKIDEELPPNVHVRPWMPQPSILAHPNVKVFITHGGQLSTLEAVHAGVPLLAVPVFGDQPANAERAVKSGYALKVAFNEDMADELNEKLMEILYNSTYIERVKFLSKIFRARPVPPSKLIAHYIELAIETKGAYHLRSISLQYSWVERWMLDLVALVLAALILLLSFLKVVFTAICRKLCGKSKSQKESKRDTRRKKNN